MVGLNVRQALGKRWICRLQCYKNINEFIRSIENLHRHLRFLHFQVLISPFCFLLNRLVWRITRYQMTVGYNSRKNDLSLMLTYWIFYCFSSWPRQTIELKLLISSQARIFTPLYGHFEFGVHFRYPFQLNQSVYLGHKHLLCLQITITIYFNIKAIASLFTYHHSCKYWCIILKLLLSGSYTRFCIDQNKHFL